jgi:hypothetical protein
LRLISLCLAAILALSLQPARAEQPMVVVELFTSQGCNACPPADELLARLAKDPGIVALSLHVDYWDYLGWRDRFGRPENTKRQKLYAKAHHARSIYTPQIIVQGRWRTVGSDEIEVLNAIAAARAQIVPVTRTLLTLPDRVELRIRPLAEVRFEKNGVLHLVSYDRPQTVRIERGENEGREITYINVVRDWMQLGVWDGREEAVYSAPLPVMGQGVAVLLQDGTAGPILAAARVEP